MLAITQLTVNEGCCLLYGESLRITEVLHLVRLWPELQRIPQGTQPFVFQYFMV